MGSDLAECWFSSSTFNWFGHQSRLVRPTGAPWLKGHLASAVVVLFDMVVKLISPQSTIWAAIVEILFSTRYHRHCLWKCISSATWWRWRGREISPAPP